MSWRFAIRKKCFARCPFRVPHIFCGRVPGRRSKTSLPLGWYLLPIQGKKTFCGDVDGTFGDGFKLSSDLASVEAMTGELHAIAIVFSKLSTDLVSVEAAIGRLLD